MALTLTDGELLDLLPSSMNSDIDMICLSHAIKAVTDDILRYETETMTVNFIDALPENILDVIAVEWRTQYYDQSLDISVKRELVKNTFLWHEKAGTVSAVKELIATVFGEAKLEEWWDFEEGEQEPGYFDIVTNGTSVFDQMERFLNMIRMVKNVRSHLRNIRVEQEVFEKIYRGTASYGYIVNPPIDQAFVITWETLYQQNRNGQSSYGYTINAPILA